MYGDLPKYATLLVISDTTVFKRDGKAYGFGPVVKEIDAMLHLFKEITWIGFNRQAQAYNKSSLLISSERVKVIPLQHVGGTTLKDKVSIIKQYPSMWKIINSEIKKHTYIHCRAPSNPAFIAMRLSKKYPKKQFWFKYAGNWVGKVPYFYRLQRDLLKKLNKNSLITVNGTWDNQSENILAFENPCLTESHRKEGEVTIQGKLYTKHKKYCFVGGLNHNKGILLLLEALKTTINEEFGELHIVGDGNLEHVVSSKVSGLNHKINLHGSLSKKQVHEVYKKCHFIVLPSKSEGFPKVIGEAMNFGCIPIVSDISCIGQYIDTDKTGFLITPIDEVEIKKALQKSFSLSEEKFKNIINLNYKLAEKFTYTHYLERIEKDIFKNP
ncbi:MAG: hypothetical protein CMC13_11475 [Flavobacteriaceae bacterium]|nr:hypothetical protein [Flavobacteriaceae bacterium]|tara:strand:- start:58532 stop:59680 length:1149 start_codon:yes stop_codon:yes gene_type:complete